MLSAVVSFILTRLLVMSVSAMLLIYVNKEKINNRKHGLWLMVSATGVVIPLLLSVVIPASFVIAWFAGYAIGVNSVIDGRFKAPEETQE